MPPTNCTSKWRWPSVRLPASRTTAKASGSRSSSVAPSASRSRNSTVLAAQRLVRQRLHRRLQRVDLRHPALVGLEGAIVGGAEDGAGDGSEHGKPSATACPPAAGHQVGVPWAHGPTPARTHRTELGSDRTHRGPGQRQAPGQSGEGSKARGFAPGPHQRALPLGSPPRAAALGTRSLVAVREGHCGIGLGCLDHAGDRRRDPGSPGQSRNAPPSPQPNEWISKGRRLWWGSRGQSPPGGFQGSALTLLPSPDCPGACR